MQPALTLTVINAFIVKLYNLLYLRPHSPYHPTLHYLTHGHICQFFF